MMRRLIILLLILLAFAIPFFVTSRFYLHILIMCFIWGMAASSMNLIMGYTGQVNLAHGAFFGIIAFSGTVGGSVGPVLAGLAFDVMHSYRLIFMILIGLASASLLLTLRLKPAVPNNENRMP